MREIKFRAWILRDKFMGVPFEVLPRINLALGGMDEDAVLMQYTGLKDRNGVEIYEGDVLKALNGHLFEIVWYDGLACFDARSIRCHDEMMSVGWPLAEVIGNIYENPELLK